MKAAVLVAAVWLGACGSAPPRPDPIRTGDDACAECRMTILSLKTAAQIVAPGAEPVFFDDLRCLSDYRARTQLSAGAVVFVVDYPTGDWIDERDAVITRAPEQTPMGSGLIASRRTSRKHASP
jgi:copper chaperone NosL